MGMSSSCMQVAQSYTMAVISAIPCEQGHPPAPDLVVLVVTAHTPDTAIFMLKYCGPSNRGNK